jgi:hypothetical protein
MTYEITEAPLGGEILKRTDANGKVWWIPIDPANSDYQRYLRWLENPDADEAQSLYSVPPTTGGN